MNRRISVFLLSFLCGCSAEIVSKQSYTPAGAIARSGALIVTVDAGGSPHVGGLSISENDWTQLVNQWHVTSVAINGEPGAKFSDLLRIQEAIKAAGVSDVSIAQPDHGS